MRLLQCTINKAFFVVILVLLLLFHPSNGWSSSSRTSSCTTGRKGGINIETDIVPTHPTTSPTTTRRQWIVNSLVAGTGLGTLGITSSPSSPSTTAAHAIDELPMELRPYTKLAPLGKATTTLPNTKSYNLSLDELTKRLTHDLLYGSTNQGSYLLTGDISPDIFRDDCTFVDPTNRVDSLAQCQVALRILFDSQRSTLQIIQPLVADSESNTIQGIIRVRGFLQFPWNPYIKSYDSRITYKVGRDDGLIYENAQQWIGKSATEAIQESFVPTIYTPPPKSTILPPTNEPSTVTKLFDYVNGRRPIEYSDMERTEIDVLINEIAKSSSTTRSSSSSSSSSLLPGKWMLVYLQPGPNGEGIDRRIPFPEFNFNDNYQIFQSNSVTNIGEVFGPNLFVQVGGTLAAIDDTESSSSSSQYQRYRANIQQGNFCIDSHHPKCIPLPIEGVGVFDSIYLGERLRIGQNLNGGGARVVQVRLS